MKIKSLFLLAALSPALVFGMAKAQEKAQVVGVVEWYGNAPFPRLGLKAEDGTLYYLTAEKDKKEELEALYGTLLRVDGILLDEIAPPEMPGAIPMQVKGWKKL